MPEKKIIYRTNSILRTKYKSSQIRETNILEHRNARLVNIRCDAAIIWFFESQVRAPSGKQRPALRSLQRLKKLLHLGIDVKPGDIFSGDGRVALSKKDIKGSRPSRS